MGLTISLHQYMFQFQLFTAIFGDLIIQYGILHTIGDIIPHIIGEDPL